MTKETIAVLTPKKLIALNQDPLGYQARRFIKNRHFRSMGKTTDTYPEWKSCSHLIQPF